MVRSQQRCLPPPPRLPPPLAPRHLPPQDVAKKPYQFLLVGVLREYLQRELCVPTPFTLDKERVFDDFGARRARGRAGGEGRAGQERGGK